MSELISQILPPDLAAELEKKFFWWESVDSQPRSHARVIAQAMNYASFDDIRMLERTVGCYQLTEIMLQAKPGWFDDRSWELWRGRLSRATGQLIPQTPPRRSINVSSP